MMRISDLYEDREGINKKGDRFLIKPAGGMASCLGKKKKIHILALGDVGSTLLIGLRLLGGNCVESIGICDVNPEIARRFEMEINQIERACVHGQMPAVTIVSQEQLFDCDAVVFCASKGVPPVGSAHSDVRMVQLEGNVDLISKFAKRAVEKRFSGVLAVVSDPVDPLCKAAYLQGLRRDQVQGYGLGVMNSRALYYSGKDDRFADFSEEGRVFGPHGQDLVVANSLEHYNANLSLELTKMVVGSNQVIRDLGFKPYIAPALSSGAFSIIDTLDGQWNYSSVYFGKGDQGAFLGIKNRRTPYGIEVEDLPLPEKLFRRIETAYTNLKSII